LANYMNERTRLSAYLGKDDYSKKNSGQFSPETPVDRSPGKGGRKKIKPMRGNGIQLIEGGKSGHRNRDACGEKKELSKLPARSGGVGGGVWVMGKPAAEW